MVAINYQLPNHRVGKTKSRFVKLWRMLTSVRYVESLTNIYSVSGWFEREIWDLFGIYFYNHTDLRRILTDYGFKGHPLRKDFPLTGYTEVRYSHIEKRILVEEVSLTQDYRTFYFNNPWNKNI